MLPLVERESADDLPDVLLYGVRIFALARLLAHRWSRPAVQLFPVHCLQRVVQPFRRAVEPDETICSAPIRSALVKCLADNGLSEKDVPEFAAEYDDRDILFASPGTESNEQAEFFRSFGTAFGDGPQVLPHAEGFGSVPSPRPAVLAAPS